MTFVVLGAVGSRASSGPRAGQRRRGADHRLPLRARTRHADVDHGGHRARCDAGVLIKNAEALETLEKVDTLVVDKTGTLTEGKPRLAGASPRRLRAKTSCCAGASLESASEHPLAGAIVAAARGERSSLCRPRPISNRHTGQGVEARSVAGQSRSATARCCRASRSSRRLDAQADGASQRGPDRHVRGDRRPARRPARRGRSDQGFHAAKRSGRCTRRVCGS